MGSLVLAEHSGATVHVGSQQYLTFLLDGRTYALDSLCVREIIEYGQLTQVPMVSPSIRGVINLRGAVVPVIDLNVRFGRAPTEVNRRTCIIILEIADGEDHHVLGVTVDAVSEVLDVAAESIRPAPAFGSHIRTDFIRGMVRQGDEFVVLLVIEQTLSIQELSGDVDPHPAPTVPALAAP